MNGSGRLVAIVGIIIISLSTAGGLSWFIGTLAFAPLAVAGELQTLKAIVEMQADSAEKRSKSIDRLTDSVNELTTQMKIDRAKKEVLEEERKRSRDARERLSILPRGR